jgi:flagellar basal body L-ring protein FlgH
MTHLHQPLLLSTLLGAVALTGCVSSSTPMPVRMAGMDELNAITLPSLPPSLPDVVAANTPAPTRRAQRVGDAVTIRVAKASPRTAVEIAPTPMTDLAMASAQDSGDSEAARTFSATVTDVLPNGHLVVSREKLISSVQSFDPLRFKATVDPRALQNDHVVSTGALASVHLESSTGELPASSLTRFSLASE